VSAGLLITVTIPAAAGAIGGLLLVGFAIAPVVPTTLSLAGRSAPGRSGQAVATTTAAGYSAFIISPLTIGLLAQATSLRLVLALLILTSLAIAGLATRWALNTGTCSRSRNHTRPAATRAGCTQGTHLQPEAAENE
jgi:MFS family permease